MKEIINNLSLTEFRVICKVISYEKIEQFIRNKKASNAKHVCASESLMCQYIYYCRKETSTLAFIIQELNIAICNITNKSKELPVKDGNALIEIIHRLFKSGFKDNPILFFKLLDSNNPSVYLRILRAIDGSLTDSAENKKLEYFKKQIIDAKEKLDRINDDYINQFHSLKNNNDNYSFEIESLEKIDSVLLFDKTNAKMKKRTDFFSRDYSYTYTSICKVISIIDKRTEEERTALKRLADIMDNGIIIPFMSVKNFTGDVKDRDIIYYTEGPDTIDTIGVWNWRASPHRYDSQKIHIDSSYCVGMPIEIIISKSSPDIESLIKEIEIGIEIDKLSLPCLYSVYVDKNTIVGFLLSNKKCSYNNGCLNIIDDTDFINIFILNRDEIVNIEDKNFYRSMNLKAPVAYYRRKPVIDIVKDKIINRATWSEFKRRGITSKEWSALKSFLSELPTTDVISVIASDCKCSVEEATEYYSQFVAQCDKYIDGESLEDSFFITLLDNHPELMERCSKIASEQWQKQNSAMIDEANLAISDLNSQIEQRKLTLADTERLLSERKEEISEMDALFASKQKMAEDVERKIADKINKAREDAAEFISDMAFVSTTSPTINSVPAKSTVRFVTGKDIEKESIHEYSTIGLLLEIIAGNLITVGITNTGNIQTEFAAFLYSAYTECTPLLLAGPCGCDIADALSVSLFGRKAARVECTGDADDFDFKLITDNCDRIIVFNNALNGDWLNKIVAFSKNNGSDKYCILTTLFSEDLAIEPKGLLNYVVPFFTELIISRKGEFDFLGGNPSEDFVVYTSTEIKKYSNEILSEIGLGIYTRKVFRQLLSNVSDLIERKPTIDALLYYAAAYITGKLDIFSDYINNKHSDKEIKKILENYLGE